MKDEDKTKKQILKELTLLRNRIAELETLEASRHRVEKALYRQNEYLTALHETTLGLINRLELADLLQAILERAAAMMGTKHGYVYLFEPGKGKREVLRVGIGLHRTGVGYRLEKGKKSVAILVYYQMGEHRYQVIEDFLKLNLETYMGTKVIDIITAYPMLKAGDVQKNAELMERAFKTGQLLAHE